MSSRDDASEEENKRCRETTPRENLGCRSISTMLGRS
jgi:hypothetical protein